MRDARGQRRRQGQGKRDVWRSEHRKLPCVSRPGWWPSDLWEPRVNCVPHAGDPAIRPRDSDHTDWGSGYASPALFLL